MHHLQLISRMILFFFQILLLMMTGPQLCVDVEGAGEMSIVKVLIPGNP
jgi:hypothetical protein